MVLNRTGGHLATLPAPQKWQHLSFCTWCIKQCTTGLKWVDQVEGCISCRAWDRAAFLCSHPLPEVAGKVHGGSLVPCTQACTAKGRVLRLHDYGLEGLAAVAGL
jgi:hypothetical protein